jgi:replicative DNA helicase
MEQDYDQHFQPLPAWVPYSIEAEQELLGAILMNNQALPLVDTILEPFHFYENVHRQIYEVAKQLIDLGKPAGPTILQTFLPSNAEVVEGMSVRAYLARLAASATTIVNARDYAEIIRDMYFRRIMGEVASEMLKPAPCDTMKLAADSIDTLDQIISTQSIQGSTRSPMSSVALKVVDHAAKAYQNGGRIMGLSWGLVDLDRLTHGINPGLMVIAGRPGMGKTAVACSVARNLARSGAPGVFFSQEMGQEELGLRMLADELHDTRPLQYTVISSGRFDERSFPDISEAGKRIAQWPIDIDDQPKLTVSQVCARARRAARNKGIKWIIIDHLHLMKLSGNHRGNVVLELGEVTSTLKALSKELGIAVILLCQLNRQVEGRDDKRPNLSDLRFSGDIEQDADVVVMLYREAYYVARQEPSARPDSEEYATWQIKMQQCHNKLDMIFEKQRQGATGIVRVHCNIACNAVRDAADTNYNPQ